MPKFPGAIQRNPSRLATALLFLAFSSVSAQKCWAQHINDLANAPEIDTLTDKTNPPEVRERAARSLGRLHPLPDGAIRALTQVIEDNHDDESVRKSAIDAITAIAQEPGETLTAIAVLAKTLARAAGGPDPIRAATARALGRIPKDINEKDRVEARKQAVGVLLKALRKPDPDPMVRANSAWALGKMNQTIQEGDSNEKNEIIKALIQTVKITQVNVGESAAQSLITMYQEAVPELMLSLNDDKNDANVRWAVAFILGEIGANARDSAPSLARVLNSSVGDPNLRGAAAWAIGKIGREVKAGTPPFPDIVSALADALKDKDNDPNIRSNAAWALGRVGPEVKKDKPRFSDIVTGLTDAVGDPDPDIRRNAAWALGQIGPEPAIAVPSLATALVDPDPKVQTEAAVALGTIGALGDQVNTGVQVLCKALANSKNQPIVRSAAAGALGRIGADAQVAISELVKATRPTGRRESEANRDVRRTSASALISIADVLQQEGKTEAIDDLVHASAGLKENGFGQSAEQISDDADMLRSLRWFNLMKGVLVWIQRYRSIALGISAYVLFWLFLYWKSPRAVFQINEALKPVAGYKLPKFLGGIPLSYLVLGGFFHYRPRVLDAWVAQYIGSARLKFEKKRTVEQRAVHVELPVLLDDKGISALSVNDLRPYFERKRTCVLISGEGGAGKTSLACQLCRWAMASEDSMRLGKHPMLAVLLEQEDLETELGDNFLIDSVRRELRYLTGQAEPPSSELVEKLLGNRRVLVAIDGFSETSQENRNKIQPGNPTFSARALVITSRLEEKLAGMDLTVVKPMRVEGNHLSTFMEAYLVRRNKKELFDDVEYFGDLGKLSLMVGEKEVTVLLAKLYGEQMISAKEAPSKGKLPENIPDLMLEYLNELNRNARQTRLDDRAVHKVAKVIAWECLRETFRPMAARIDRVLERMAGQSDVVEERLAYLEGNLRVVQTIGAGRDRIRFTLDPLAEYLAALQVMENSGEDEQSWCKLLAETACVDFETIKGFLLALIDCCQTKGNDVKVPNSVLRELVRQQSASKPATPTCTPTVKRTEPDLRKVS